jgi:hypothetical protein
MSTLSARAAVRGLLALALALTAACSRSHPPSAPKPDYIAPPPEQHATLTPPPSPPEPPKLGDAPQLPSKP